MTTTQEPKHRDDLADLTPIAEVIEVSEGLPATSRCAYCEAQAYVEVEVFDTEANTKRPLEFCAHHYTEHESALVLQAIRIVDHRPFLAIQEAKFKGVNER